MTGGGEKHRLGRFRLRVFSPAGFLALALVLAVAYLICHAAGMRQHVGTLPIIVATGGDAVTTPVVMGAVYVLLHLVVVIVVPILVLAAGMFALLELACRRRLRGRPALPGPEEKSPRRSGSAAESAGES